MTKFLKSLLSSKAITTLLVAVVVFAVAGVTWASGGEAIIDNQGEGMLLLTLFMNLLSWAWIIVAAVAAALMDNDLIYGQIVGITGLFYQFWTLMRTIANFALVVIIISFVWQILQNPGKYKDILSKNMFKVVAAGILVNVSWFAIAQLVDVSTIAIAGTSQLTAQFMDGAGSQYAATSRQLIDALPTKIKVNSKGCLEITNRSQTNDAGRQTFVDKRNGIMGSLVFLGGAVIKLQAHTITAPCSETDATTYNFKNLTLKTVLSVLLAVMFVVPLLVLAAYNLFRLLYVWGWILLSPLFVLINLFPDETKKVGLDGLQKMGSIKTLLVSLFQPVFVVGALGVGMMFIVGMYDALGYDKMAIVDVNLNNVTNGRSMSQVSIGGASEVGRVTMFDEIVKDPTGTIGGGFGYILVTIATCMVLWMLVKLSFSISKDNPGSALGIDFDPVKLMGDIRERMMKQIRLPQTGLGGPLDGVSLQEATTLLDPTDKDNRIMNKISEVGNKMKTDGGDDAIKRMKKSSFGNLLGMNTEGELAKSDGYKFEITDGKDGEINLWNERFTQMKQEAQDLKNNGDNDYKTMPIAKGTTTYKQIKAWQESVQKLITNTYGYDDTGNKLDKEKFTEEKDFDALYSAPSYSAALLSKLLGGEKLKVKKSGDRLVLDGSLAKLDKATTTFSQIDLSK